MAGPWDKYQKEEPAPGSAPWDKYADTYLHPDDFLEDDQGRQIIPESSELAGLAIPGTISEAEYMGDVKPSAGPRRFGMSSSDTPNPLPMLAAAGDTMFGNIPVVGPYLQKGRDQINASVNNMTPEEARAGIEADKAANPEAAMAGAVAGKTLPYLAAAGVGGPVAGALGLEGSLGMRFLFGGLSSEALNVGDRKARGEDTGTALVEGTKDTVAGLPFFALGSPNAKQAVIKGAPKTSELFAEGDKLFDEVRASKLLISSPVADNFINSATSKAMNAGLDEGLTPGSVSVVKRLQGMTGKNMTIDDAMLVRKLANDAYVNAKAGSNDARIARGIVNDLDDFLGGLASKGPQGQPHMGVLSGDPVAAKAALDKANEVWSAASKAKTVDTAIEMAVQRAESSNSGMSLEAAVKSEFSKLERGIIDGNPERFTPDQVKLIRNVARGSGAQNIASYVGRMLYPRGPFSALPTLASGLGTFASTGDPILTALGSGAPAVVGALGRTLASNASKEGAQFASASIRNRALGSQFAPGGNAEISPMLKALPSSAGRAVTTMSLGQWAQQQPLPAQ